MLLILKMPSSELKNILQLSKTKNVIININDTLHNDVSSGYYIFTDWYVDEEDNDQVIITMRALKGLNMVQLFTPEALDNPELYTPISDPPAA